MFHGVATSIDGTSVIIGGYTDGSWMEFNEAEGEKDFAGMLMDADGTALWTYQVLIYYSRIRCLPPLGIDFTCPISPKMWWYSRTALHL